jgi:hypothetical protein
MSYRCKNIALPPQWFAIMSFSVGFSGRAFQGKKKAQKQRFHSEFWHAAKFPVATVSATKVYFHHNF